MTHWTEGPDFDPANPFSADLGPDPAEPWERQQVAEHEAETESVGARRTWPTLDPKAFQGLAGDIPRVLDETTEADPAAVLAQALAIFGWLVGNTGNAGHLLIANEQHGPRVWPVIVGDTSSGAKGTSWAAAWRPFRKLLEGDTSTPVHSNGLSSGEGLIEAVRDEIGDPADEKGWFPGVDDKRLLVRETELASVFHRMNREGNTLGPLLRQAWDGGDLRTLTRKPISATDPHIVLVGHISPGELAAVVRAQDVNGGTLNRFLFIASRRSKRLPYGGNAPPEVVEDLAIRIGRALLAASTAGRVNLSEDGSRVWAGMYSRLTADRPDSVLTKATGRRAPHVLRLALLYALMDECRTIDVRHLEAAAALEQYSVDTAAYVFSASQATARQQSMAELAKFIEDGGIDGRTRTEISREHFRGNRKASEITLMLRELVESGHVRETTEGRKTVYRHTNCASNRKATNLRIVDRSA